jgi:hypothetical protein
VSRRVAAATALGAGVIALALLVSSCSASRGTDDTGGGATRVLDPMREILEGHPGLAQLLPRASEHRIQAVLGKVEVPDDGGRPFLVQYGYRAGDEYFYPASTVKLFAAVAALEWLAEMSRATGRAIGPDTHLVFHPLFPGESIADRDPTNLDGGAITVRNEIRKLFLVSDNEAFNRLYELVGQDGLARSLERAGIPDARIVHRLSERRTPEENRRYPRIDLVGDGFVETLPERTSPPLLPLPLRVGLQIGTAYLEDERRIEGPMDFAAKNAVSLVDLQRGLCKVVRPDVDCGGIRSPGAAVGEPFALDVDGRALVMEAMSQFPGQSRNPVYDVRDFPDEYAKWVLPGLRRSELGRRAKLYDKSGQAYGFTIENAYVEHPDGGPHFFLAATIYTNSDGVLNDDHYDYESVALPFFADLAEAVVKRLWSR